MIHILGEYKEICIGINEEKLRKRNDIGIVKNRI